MPTIMLNKQAVMRLMGRSVPDKVLAEKIPLLGTDLKEITKSEIHVEVFPNRPDMLSEEGFARALSSFLGIRRGLREYKVKSSSYTYAYDPRVKRVRPYCAVAVVKGLRLSSDAVESLMSLQEKLHTTHGRNRKRVAMGIHDLDAVVFPLVYTVRKPDVAFTPLDGKGEMTLGEILEVHKKGQAYAHLLEGFKEYPVWVDANDQIVSMPPVINAEATRVTEKTRDVVLDVTGWNREAVEQALRILVAACVDRGGTAYRVSCTSKGYKASHPSMESLKVRMDVKEVNKLLGLSLSVKEVKGLVERMGLGMQGNVVLVPAYRTDVLSAVDVIEDVGIAFGYDKLKEEIPQISTIGEECRGEVLKRKVAEACIGLGLSEVSSYHLVNEEEVTTWVNSNVSVVRLVNSVSKEYDCLRPSMIPSLLKVLSVNKHHEYPQNLFEIGRVFSEKNGEVVESVHAGGVVCHGEANFTEARQSIEALLASFGLSGTFKEDELGLCVPGRCARVIVNGKQVARVGEVHPEVLSRFGVQMPVVVFEVNLTELFNL